MTVVELLAAESASFEEIGANWEASRLSRFSCGGERCGSLLETGKADWPC